MLKPSGPVKNSGKIVTTLILSGTLLFAERRVDQTERVVDQDGARHDIGADHELRPIRKQHASTRGLDVEHESLRELVKCRHRADFLAVRTHGFHSYQIVEVDLILLQWRQFGEWGQQVASAPELGAVAIGELLEPDDEAFLEWLRGGNGERRNHLLTHDIPHH